MSETDVTFRTAEEGPTMNIKPQEDLARRTRRFALAIIRLYVALPRSALSFVLGRQLLKSGTSVGAHYREARRAKSDADFISKMEGALQELDETGYWLELLQDARIAKSPVVETLLAESNELIAIFVSVVRKVKSDMYSAA
jgi:four helix bundle protein